MASEKSDIEDALKCCGKTNSFMCCINCNTIYHKSCAERNVSNNKFTKIDKNKVICCNLSNGCKHNLQIEHLKEEIIQLKELIKSLIVKINEQNSDIKTKETYKLSNNRSESACEVENHMVSKTKESLEKVHTNQKEIYENKKIQAKAMVSSANTLETEKKSKNPNIITLNEQNKRILEYETRKKLNEIINMEPRENEQSSWSEVVKKKNKIQRKKDVVVGTLRVEDDKFKAIPKTKKIWIHAGRFHPNLTSEELLKYLKEKYNTQDIICEKIKNKYENPKLSSFKIGVDITLKEQMYDKCAWPEGVEISRFNFFRAQRNEVEYYQ